MKAEIKLLSNIKNAKILPTGLIREIKTLSIQAYHIQEGSSPISRVMGTRII
jgi:hypothetical protein